MTKWSPSQYEDAMLAAIDKPLKLKNRPGHKGRNQNKLIYSPRLYSQSPSSSQEIETSGYRLVRRERVSPNREGLQLSLVRPEVPFSS